MPKNENDGKQKQGLDGEVNTKNFKGEQNTHTHKHTQTQSHTHTTQKKHTHNSKVPIWAN